jgi:hypothetical protein
MYSRQLAVFNSASLSPNNFDRNESMSLRRSKSSNGLEKTKTFNVSPFHINLSEASRPFANPEIGIIRRIANLFTLPEPRTLN